jgi:predicted ATP-grasp superfamily ATP-dependent carboligase
MKPATVLSTHTIGLTVIRGLGVAGVPVNAVYYDKHDMGYVSRYVKESMFAPHPEEREDQFVDSLVESAGRFGGGLLIPANDATLVAVSRHKSILDRHYTVACTEWEITEKIVDKKHTYALAEEIGVPAPKTMVPRSVDDVEMFDQTAQYPCLVKPTQVHQYFDAFGIKMVKVSNFDQMLAEYQRAADAGIEVMLQEWIPGEDSDGVSYHAYFWDDQALVEFTAQQLRNAPPEIGSPRLMMSKHIPEVIEPGRKIIQALGHYGYSCTEFKRDPRDGVYKLMEVNGRHSVAEALDRHCGINFAWLEYKHLMLGELPSASDYRNGVYWIHLTTDVSHSFKHRKIERYTLKQYIEPYLSPHAFAILDLRDPRPFLQRGVEAVRRVLEFAHAKLRRSRRPVSEAETKSLGSLDHKVDPTS